MNKERFLVVVSGPSGSGKDTVVSSLRATHAGIERTVSVTTRGKRTGEQQGVDYFYATQEQFAEKLANNDILEHTNFCGNYYGTSKSEVDARLENGVTTILIIEVEGAGNIKKIYPDCTTIFIKPPSEEVLEQRLRARKTDSDEAIAKRLERSKQELEFSVDFDFNVINDTVDVCAVDIYDIISKRQSD